MFENHIQTRAVFQKQKFKNQTAKLTCPPLAQSRQVVAGKPQERRQ